MELWQPVPDNLDYMVSTLGRVRSLARVVTNCNGVSQPIRERIMKWQISDDGYPVVSLRLARRATPPRTVHSIVMMAFAGPPPAGLMVCHEDGNPGNPNYLNLRYDTMAANMQDAVAHGTTTAGERNCMAKLVDADIIEIRRRCAAGESDASVALDFDISRSSVTYIRQRKTWRHVA